MTKSNSKFSLEKKPLTRSLERSNVDLDMDMALDAILSTSPYGAEEDLKEQLHRLASQKKKSGTKIVLFNLKW